MRYGFLAIGFLAIGFGFGFGASAYERHAAFLAWQEKIAQQIAEDRLVATMEFEPGEME